MPSKIRVAVIDIEADVDWLTDDGELTEATGWEAALSLLQNALQTAFPTWRSGPKVTSHFVEWSSPQDTP